MKKTIFISSTFTDLASPRKAIWDLLKEFDVWVRGMEQFGARTATPLETCIAEVEQSDIYVGVIGFRLGSIEPVSGKSYTQLEYERAQALSKETFIYLIDEENALVLRKHIDKGADLEKLEAFKRTLRERHTVDTFVSAGDLVEKLRRDLSRHLAPAASVRNRPSNEFDEASSIIDGFLLVPKKYAGREVRLVVKVTRQAYPASNEICTAFNYELGATVGVGVQIVNPQVEGGDSLNELYLDSKQIEELFPLSVDDQHDIYAKLLFADTPVQRVRARYSDASYYPDSPLSALGTVSSFLGKRVDLPADAKMILAFTKKAVG